MEVESSNCGHCDNRLLREIDHSGCLALSSLNIFDDCQVSYITQGHTFIFVFFQNRMQTEILIPLLSEYNSF